MVQLTIQEIHEWVRMIQLDQEKERKALEEDRTKNYPPIPDLPRYSLQTSIGKEILKLSWELYDLPTPAAYSELYLHGSTKDQAHWEYYRKTYRDTKDSFYYPRVRVIKDAIKELKKVHSWIDKYYRNVSQRICTKRKESDTTGISI